MELQIGASNSLKAKRAVVRPILETAKRRFGVSASETGHHDLWQRADVGFAVVAPTVGHVETLLDRTERFVWSHLEVEVLTSTRHWLVIEE
jgi:uncharacterized protein YlxP (DUF503 family)